MTQLSVSRVMRHSTKAGQSVFRSYGMNNPLSRIQMLDGLNKGGLHFVFTTMPRYGS